MIDAGDDVSVAVAGGALTDLGVADGWKEEGGDVAGGRERVTVGVVLPDTSVEVEVTLRLNALTRTEGMLLKYKIVHVARRKIVAVETITRRMERVLRATLAQNNRI